ncbi:hypothetical protein BDU57DRAFT_511236 [Ampelomyces quisqualis]|uniref:F-box domain-containing protein n=1 Tax=Ampelomyces quisqualis TaxID=50730 RepID=A0A6A5R1Y5_AMPQU|nr:hypothetical protein BDU57DRAFT_511236 [Ampelomyces quisqualis]
MATLLSLPNELLQQVASYLPFASLLNLQRLSRRLHGICNDRLVLQGIAQHCFSNTRGAKESLLRVLAASNRNDLDPSQLEWLEGGSVLADASIDEAKYLAYAAQRCTEAVLIQPPANQKEWASHLSPWNTSFDISEWLPQLLALHHPATLALEPDAFLRPICEVHQRRLHTRNESISDPSATPDEQRAEFINLHFVICYVTLQRLGNTRDYTETTRQFENYFCPSSTNHDTALATANNFRETIRLLCDHVTDYPHEDIASSQSQAFSWILPLMLQIAVQFPLAIREHGPLPKSTKIPFQTFMEIRSLYPAGGSFSTCHLQKTTSPDFLTGKWIGYYTDERQSRGLSQPTTRYDPPMVDVQIVARKPLEHELNTEAISAKIDLQSRGFDAHGEFTLEGQVSFKGEVTLVKQYIFAGWTWRWSGCITPFGIVGDWSGRRYGGHFWIWKVEWC